MAVKQNNTENNNAASSGQNGKINNQKKTWELSTIMNFIEVVTNKQQEGEIFRDKNHVLFNHTIGLLSKVVVSNRPQEVKRFKEDIEKVGEFLIKLAEDDPATMYVLYLRTVYDMISRVDAPSGAIAIIFQLFPKEFINKAVSMVLSSNENVSDEAVRKTVNNMCTWLRYCYFCQNLNIWILSILSGLLDQQKYELLYNIAMDVIDPLFLSLIVPIIRPNVAPVVCQILSSIKHTPAVFHKIIGRAPKVIAQLKRDSSKEDCKNILQTIVDLISALMVQFQGYDELYKQTEEALADLNPSYDYRSILNYPAWGAPESTYSISSNPRVGLVNLGNTCYMNSVLQALAMTKEFSRYILLSQSTSPIQMKIQQLFALMLHSSRPELTPSKVLHAARPPGFVPGLQQDSSEFLGYLMEILNEQDTTFLNRLHNETTQSIQSVDYSDEEGATSRNFKSNTSNNMTKCKNSNKITTVEKTFGGKITTTYQCSTCNWQSKNIDNSRDLQLSFPDVKTDCASNYSVQDLLDYYCSPEKLDGDNQYHCERCKKLTDAERFINIVSAPKNLILTLKHFKYDQKYHLRAKLMHKVFHDESLSLKVHSSETLSEVCSVNYNLYAAVVHSGYSMDSGHYYTYASDNSDNWYKFNDNVVTSCDIAELHNLNPPNTPYILFYRMNSQTSENSSSNLITIEETVLPTIEELPGHLRDCIIRENNSYAEELRIRNLSRANQADLITMQNKKRNNRDHDDEPPSACGGGNNFNIVNRFIS